MQNGWVPLFARLARQFVFAISCLVIAGNWFQTRETKLLLPNKFVSFLYVYFYYFSTIFQFMFVRTVETISGDARQVCFKFGWIFLVFYVIILFILQFTDGFSRVEGIIFKRCLLLHEVNKIPQLRFVMVFPTDVENRPIPSLL